MNEEYIYNKLLVNSLEYIAEEKNGLYFSDPILHIKRNRVTAEICRGLIRTCFEEYQEKIDKMIQWLISNQNKDGSWNEIHPFYNKPSALATSFVAETLLLYYMKTQNPNLKEILRKSRDYILSQEYFPGYFKKSEENYSDCLNVNAACGSFLAQYGKIFNDKKCINESYKTAHRVCYYQFNNGSFPYTTRDNGYPYPYHFYVPCIHYQGVTTYYLIKIQRIIEENWLHAAILRATNWLAITQKNNGKFDWSKSGLLFSYYLSGAYAFAYALFKYSSIWNDKYKINMKNSLKILEENIDKIAWRWETDTWRSFPFSTLISLKTALIGDYPLKHKLFRFGYGSYRQFARRRLSKEIDEKLFNNLKKILNIQHSTIEPLNNYQDLFMTSEILDCLSYSILPLNGGKNYSKTYVKNY